jgi:energy-converting hydrogenase Eha subunit C
VATLEPVQLRPLGIGEIFDRAVTLYVRNFVLFVIISAFLVVPLSIVNYFIVAGRTGTFAQIFDQIKHPAQNAGIVDPIVPWFGVFVVLTFFVTPFMYVAMAAALGSIYSGERTDWRAAYAVALRHFGGILATAFCQMAILIVAIFAGAIAVSLAFVAAFLLVRFIAPLGVLTIILAIVLFIAYVLAVMLSYLATALAFDAIGIERVPFGRALSGAFERVFNRAELAKATLICLAFIAVELGLMIVLAVADSVIETFLHQPVIETLFQAVFSLVTTGFIGVLIAVYYFDVRIRREGLDMQAAVDQLQAAT